MRVANPRQGDFAEPDQRFKGEGPGLAHMPHFYDMVENAHCANAFHRSVDFLLRGGSDPLICDQLTSVSAVRAGSSVPRGA